jgi:hypothetical protein
MIEKRLLRTASCLVLAALAAVSAVGCARTEALEVTYYYLPG